MKVFWQYMVSNFSKKKNLYYQMSKQQKMPKATEPVIATRLKFRLTPLCFRPHNSADWSSYSGEREWQHCSYPMISSSVSGSTSHRTSNTGWQSRSARMLTAELLGAVRIRGNGTQHQCRNGEANGWTVQQSAQDRCTRKALRCRMNSTPSKSKG